MNRFLNDSPFVTINKTLVVRLINIDQVMKCRGALRVRIAGKWIKADRDCVPGILAAMHVDGDKL